MRLTAMVDDLTARLRVAQQKATAAEAQVQTTHAALLQERQASATRIKNVNAELGQSRAVETQLRGELSKAAQAAKHTVASSKFEEAVTAVMKADDLKQKSDKEIARLAEDVASRDAKLELTTQQLIELHDKNTTANVALEEATEKNAIANRKLELARAAELEAREQRSAAVEQLSAALEKQRLSEEIAAEQLNRAADAERRLGEVGAPEAEMAALLEQARQEAATACASRVEVEAELRESQQNQKLQQESLQSIHAELATQTERAEEAERRLADSPSEPERVPYSVVDAVGMYRTYNSLRAQIVEQSKVAARSNDDASHAKVRSLVDEARQLKAQYDLIFGAVQAEEPAAEAVEVAGAFTVGGDAPELVVAVAETSPIASLATMASFGAAVELHKLDCNVSICDAFVEPLWKEDSPSETMVDLLTAEEEVPTGDHEKEDVDADMVKAVVTDLKLFFRAANHEKTKLSSLDPLVKPSPMAPLKEDV